jgi:hypothetical protein
MEQFCSQFELGFEIVTSIRAVTLRRSPGSAIDFNEVNSNTPYSEQASQARSIDAKSCPGSFS